MTKSAVPPTDLVPYIISSARALYRPIFFSRGSICILARVQHITALPQALDLVTLYRLGEEKEIISGRAYM